MRLSASFRAVALTAVFPVVDAAEGAIVLEENPLVALGKWIFPDAAVDEKTTTEPTSTSAPSASASWQSLAHNDALLSSLSLSQQSKLCVAVVRRRNVDLPACLNLLGKEAPKALPGSLLVACDSLRKMAGPCPASSGAVASHLQHDHSVFLKNADAPAPQKSFASAVKANLPSVAGAVLAMEKKSKTGTKYIVTKNKNAGFAAAMHKNLSKRVERDRSVVVEQKTSAKASRSSTSKASSFANSVKSNIAASKSNAFSAAMARFKRMMEASVSKHGFSRAISSYVRRTHSKQSDKRAVHRVKKISKQPSKRAAPRVMNKFSAAIAGNVAREAQVRAAQKKMAPKVKEVVNTKETALARPQVLRAPRSASSDHQAAPSSFVQGCQNLVQHIHATRVTALEGSDSLQDVVGFSTEEAAAIAECTLGAAVCQDMSRAFVSLGSPPKESFCAVYEAALRKRGGMPVAVATAAKASSKGSIKKSEVDATKVIKKKVVKTQRPPKTKSLVEQEKKPTASGGNKGQKKAMQVGAPAPTGEDAGHEEDSDIVDAILGGI